MKCTQCRTEITLSQDATNRLHATCNCSDRNVRVSKALPESWTE